VPRSICGIAIKNLKGGKPKMKTAKSIMFRVECNHGSRYFDSGIKAYVYYQCKLQTVKGYVQLWLVIKEANCCVLQELIASDEIMVVA